MGSNFTVCLPACADFIWLSEVANIKSGRSGGGEERRWNCDSEISTPKRCACRIRGEH